MSVSLIVLLVIVALLMVAWMSWSRSARTKDTSSPVGMTPDEVAQALGYTPREAPSVSAEDSAKLTEDVEAWRDKNATIASEPADEPVITVKPAAHHDAGNITDSDIDDHLRRVLGNSDAGDT